MAAAAAPPGIRPDYTIDQNWTGYTIEDHRVWRTLYRRQDALLPGRVVPEFLDALHRLDISPDAIPDFRRLTALLEPVTGWRIVAVPGLVPGAIFFEHLANRRFPVTAWIRRPDQMDYLEEPDLFHDLFGHVPLLMNPVFADYMQRYGQAAQKAEHQGALDFIGRLYWYTVEFGLMATPAGLRIFGAGIVSSKGETVWCLDDPSPNRIGFHRERVMRTDYRIDDFQETYFVIDSFAQLFHSIAGDLAPLFAKVAVEPLLGAGAVLPTDRVFHRGTGGYHRSKRGSALAGAAKGPPVPSSSLAKG